MCGLSPGAFARSQLHLLGMVLCDSQTDERLAARTVEGEVSCVCLVGRHSLVVGVSVCGSSLQSVLPIYVSFPSVRKKYGKEDSGIEWKAVT